MAFYLRPSTRKRKTSKDGSPLESEIQRDYFALIRLMRLQDERFYAIYHVPNEGKRSGYSGFNQKLGGLTNGVWDINIAIPMGEHPGMWIETKRIDAKGKRTELSDSQKKWGKIMHGLGHKMRVAYTTDDLIKLTKEYLEII